MKEEMNESKEENNYNKYAMIHPALDKEKVSNYNVQLKQDKLEIIEKNLSVI